MFEGFTQTQIDTSGARINLRHGGSGPPLLLLHGNPLTHVMWHKIAPRLAEHFTVVATDLRGYGDSSKPRRRRRPHRLLVPRDGAGPGRGDDGARLRALRCLRPRPRRRASRTAWRSIIRERVKKVAFLDIVPTHHMLNNIKKAVGGRFVPLVLHGAALRLSRADADGVRSRALHPEEARQEGRRA